MKKQGLLLILLISLFASCTVPQTRSVTRQTRAAFDYQKLTKEMLSETVWCGKMTTTIKNNPQREVYMAVYFLDGKAGVARGRTPEEAAGTAVYRALQYKGTYQISGSGVTILDFWDGGYQLGRASAKIDFQNNNEAIIKLFYKEDKAEGPIAYEVQTALQIDGCVDK